MGDTSTSQDKDEDNVPGWACRVPSARWTFFTVAGSARVFFFNLLWDHCSSPPTRAQQERHFGAGGFGHTFEIVFSGLRGQTLKQTRHKLGWQPTGRDPSTPLQRKKQPWAARGAPAPAACAAARRPPRRSRSRAAAGTGRAPPAP